jgi:DNA-binding CsgD family transcriptional regulator
MINKNKITEKKPFSTTIAGIHPADDRIEFFGAINPTSKKPEVFWIQNGGTHLWQHLSADNKTTCYNALLKDKPAYSYLTAKYTEASENRKTELFIYTNYGHLDNTPDMIKGVLQPSENFRLTEDCPSYNWDSKWFTLNGQVLTRREIRIIDLLKKEYTNKVIADFLGLSHSYLDQVKRDLCKKVGVVSQSGLLMLAMQEKMIA